MTPRRLFHTLREWHEDIVSQDLQINRLHWSPSSINILWRETGDTKTKKKSGGKGIKFPKDKESGIRESNPPFRLGKPAHYRYANSAYKKYD